jgi:hypothetical protein
MKLFIICSAGLVCLLGCLLCLSEQAIVALTSLRAIFVLVVLFWVRCECFMWLRADAMCHAVEAMRRTVEAYKNVKRGGDTAVNLSDYHALLCEINSLSQTIVNLSDQRNLLREMKGAVLKSARYSRTVLGLLNGGSCSPKGGSGSSERVRRKLRRSSLSDSCLSSPRAPSSSS